MTTDYKEWVNEKVLEHLPFDRVYSSSKGGCYLFRCPICGDSKKNILKKRGCWFTKTASYHCYNCGTNISNGINFLSYLSNVDVAEIKKEYIKMKYNGGSGYNLLSTMKDFNKKKEVNILDFEPIIKPNWKKELTPDALAYLNGRKVLDAPFLKEKLFSCTLRDREYILIPWKINDTDCYFQINDFKKYDQNGRKYIFPKDKDKLIYGLDNIDLSWEYIICFEGVYDSLFVKNGIAIGGKYLTELQMKILKKRYPHHKIVMALDNDKPGLIEAGNCIRKNQNYKYFKWFDDNTKQKDINDFILANNDVNIFTDKTKLESMIIDPLMMKMFLVHKNLWNVNDTNK